jgi:hypothetical protein
MGVLFELDLSDHSDCDGQQYEQGKPDDKAAA